MAFPMNHLCAVFRRLGLGFLGGTASANAALDIAEFALFGKKSVFLEAFLSLGSRVFHT